MIPLNILEAYNAIEKKYSKDSIIFNEGEQPQYYYQIHKGTVKMLNLSEDGKAFVQGFFADNNSFGEPPLFGDHRYPATAICTSDCTLYLLPKASFFELLKALPDIHFSFTKLLCKRIVYKAKVAKEISLYPADHRVLTMLSYLKENSAVKTAYEVTITRQEISELTGLRVETVIRAIKKLEKSNKLSIKGRKIFL